MRYCANAPRFPRKNKAMKARITSNFRPPLRAFYAFLIASAVLWAIPRNARAQHLYVTQILPDLAGVVSEIQRYYGKGN